QQIQTERLQASIGLVEDASTSLSMTKGTPVYDIVRPDTLVVHDDDGREMIIMKAVKDENGEMVATDVINAAVVEARFRNVAERHGKVDIKFQIRVPKEMQDEQWQLRFYPRMHILEDTLKLDQVIITGAKYRKAQLKGYQQYEKYLASIVTDTTRFINMRLLELFIQRNIPDLYAFKADSTEVADEHFNAILDTKVAGNFASGFGVTGRDAIEHYTNTISKRLNARRWEQREKIYRRYVKAPIVHEGLRLDTMITASNGDFIYNYVQTIATRPMLRKVDVVLSGDIFEQDKCLYEIPETEPLTYYISSLSAFVDGTPRYKKQIISRRVQANTACYIDFEQGSAEIAEDMSNNRFEMGRIKQNLASLIENKVFDLDSIIVTANCSPEGSVPFNARLSQKRSEAVSRYFEAFIREYRDKMELEAAAHYYFDGGSEEEILRFAQNDKRGTQHDSQDVKFISRNNPENWRMLDVLVAEDTVLTAFQKQEYKDLAAIADADQREWALSHAEYYKHLREDLYPRLRTVKFDFHLHRKGMVKDTIQTTVLNEEYMAGVQAIRDRDYETAIRILRPYKDYNAAVAFCAMDYNASALAILETLPQTDQVHYMLAVIYSRQGRDRDAVEHYLKACKLTPSYWHRGNLDPEIAALIKRYNLNRE
ncbi:MAG: tetratricopeptide repeat protein, partial [Bacteroidales bacterium]|nr:tetratricopeptide repeat protein [Bacteroidales bacterium]